MKLIKASYKIISPINGEEILKQIELAARTCYKSENKIECEDLIGCTKSYNGDNTQDDVKIKDYYAVSARVLISKLISMKHDAVLEFGGMITVKFICDRGVSHELVRHRLSSFAQESTRYCNYGKDEHISFIIPSWIKTLTEGVYVKDDIQTSYVKQWLSIMQNCEYNYNILLKDYNWSPQEARSVLPNSLKTEINVSANLREWRHILKLRTNKAAHPQMRELMCPLLNELKIKIPILFDDINYK
jgi:thymidylate synthase (FAD)